MDDYPMSGPIDISIDAFAERLIDSPSFGEVEQMYDACLEEGVSPCVFLAFFNHESKYGTLGICAEYDTRNPGNVRSPEDPHAGNIIATRGGPFAIYPTWENGTIDWAKRIQGPKYAGDGRLTVRQVLPRYAPTGDGNDPEAYIRSVLGYVETYGDPMIVAEQAIYAETDMITITNLIDIRDRLPTMEDGEGGVARGPYGEATDKRGSVIHHDGGVPINMANFAYDPVAFLTGRAWFHINKNWATQSKPVYGSGIMYHICVGPDGEAYQLRGLMQRLWHCGDQNLNERGLAIYVPTGGDQSPTLPMMERITAILDEYRQQTGDPAWKVYGHGEVTSTECPGPHLLKYVDAYRSDTLKPATPPTEDEMLEYHYQQNPGLYGAKISKIWLKRPYYEGDALRCERAILTLAGADVLNNVVDDGITLLAPDAGTY